MSNQKDIKLPEGLQNYIQQSRLNNNGGNNRDNNEDHDFNTCWSLKSMFASVKDDAIKILPTLSEFISAMTSENMFIRKGNNFSSIFFVKLKFQHDIFFMKFYSKRLYL